MEAARVADALVAQFPLPSQFASNPIKLFVNTNRQSITKRNKNLQALVGLVAETVFVVASRQTDGCKIEKVFEINKENPLKKRGILGRFPGECTEQLLRCTSKTVASD